MLAHPEWLLCARNRSFLILSLIKTPCWQDVSGSAGYRTSGAGWHVCGTIAWPSGFAVLAQDVRNCYMFIKALRLGGKRKNKHTSKKASRDFPLLGTHRSGESLLSLQPQPQSQSLASLGSLDECSPRGTISLGHLRTPH